MKAVIRYVLQDKKVTEGYVMVTGPYSPELISVNGVYDAFLEEKQLWGKDSGRMFAHNVISFHANDFVTPAECLEIGRQFCEKFFPNHQNLIAVHQDRDHLHVHIVTNTVSFMDGRKLHQTKYDLQRQKDFTNELCRIRGLSVTEKGKHFNGTEIESGEIRAWNKDKYQMLINEQKESYMINCAEAIVETVPECSDSKEFVAKMELRGWIVSWNENKGHIVFRNNAGRTVRDTNLTGTFTFNIGLEEIINEFTDTLNELDNTQGSAEELYARKIGELILLVADLLFNELKKALTPDYNSGKGRGKQRTSAGIAIDERAKFDAFLASIHSRARAGQDDAALYIRDAGATIEDSLAYRREQETSKQSGEIRRRSRGPELG